MASSSDSSSDSEIDAELDSKVSELEDKLLDSPYHYEWYVELIELLRQQGDLDKARQARNSMRKLFPLTEELWLGWLGDELPLCGLFPEAVMEMRLLFESATDDYLSVQLWLEYAQFATEKMSLMPEVVAFPRDVFERAIVACGLHIGQSGLIWDAYIGFERVILQSLLEVQTEGGDIDMETKEQTASQYERVDKLYRRRLTVPHIGMENALKEYQTSFLEVDSTKESLPAYVRAKKKLEEYLPFENQLLSSDPPSLECYHDYLAHLTSSRGDPSLLNTLYLRALAHHCLDTQLWQDYLHFLDHHFSTAGSVVVPGYRLAVRTCPWDIKFWLGLVTAMERNKRDHQETMAMFEKSLVDTFSSASDYLAMWTAYIDYQRRRLDSISTQNSQPGPCNTGSEDGRAELLVLFRRARTKLKEDFGKDGDPKDMLSRYHANIERDVVEGRSIWEDIMTRHGREAQYWLDYITYIRTREGLERCSKLFQLAVNSANDVPLRVCEAYVQFEREHGTLLSYEAAVQRTRSQMKRIREREEVAAEKEATKKDELKRKRMEKRPPTRKGNEQQPHGSGDSRSQRSSLQRYQQQPRDRSDPPGLQRSNQRKRKADFLKDSDKKNETKKQRVGGPSVSSIQPAIDISRGDGGPGAIAMEASTAADETIKKPAEKHERKEERTVFVSNLSPRVTEDELRNKFSEVGEVAEVRLVHSKRVSTRVNTFAYVEFASATSVQQALALDRTLFMDKNIYVSPFKEKGANPTYPPRTFDEAENYTVYVNNLQKDVNEDTLMQLFKQCGEVKEVRLVRNVEGRSKGYAYVEFKAKSSALEAVEKLNLHLLSLKQIGVAMSRAPRKYAEQATATEKDDGGFLRPNFIPRRGVEQTDDVPKVPKSKLSLMPRVLSRVGAVKAHGSPRPSEGKLSNDDFRKLFSNSSK